MTSENNNKSILRNLYPKYVFQKVEDIPYELLNRDGIRLILMDMDNTLIDSKCNYSKELRKWIKNIKSKGIILYIVSNSYSQKKLKKVSKELGLKYLYKAFKPSRRGIRKVCDQFPEISKKEIMMVGDQLFTDIWAGNRYNINTVLVERINKKETWISKIKRPLEKMILNHYYKKEENSKKC